MKSKSEKKTQRREEILAPRLLACLLDPALSTLSSNAAPLCLSNSRHCLLDLPLRNKFTLQGYRTNIWCIYFYLCLYRCLSPSCLISFSPFSFFLSFFSSLLPPPFCLCKLTRKYKRFYLHLCFLFHTRKNFPIDTPLFQHFYLITPVIMSK